jgi:hypothetical protein
MARNELRLRRGRPSLRVTTWQSIIPYLLLVLFVPMVVAGSLGLLGVLTPQTIGANSVGVLWQVQAAVLGLGISLAVYGYEALGRAGPLDPEDFAALTLPRGIYLGLALLVLTGIAFFLAPDPTVVPGGERSTWNHWLPYAAILLSIIWAAVLVRALPEVVKVADPGFRTKIRRSRLARLANLAAERRLIEIASFSILQRLMRTTGAEWVPWLMDLGGDSSPLRLRRSGYVADIHFERLGALLVAHPGIQVNLRLNQPVRSGDQAAAVEGETPGLAEQLDRSLYTVKTLPADDLEKVIEGLRDEARRAMSARPNAVTEVLESYEAALTVFAEKWARHLGPMAADDLREPLRPDTTPLGLVRLAVIELMRTAIQTETRQAIDELGFFPVRLARLGLQHRSSAYVSALSLCTSYLFLARQLSDSSESRRAARAWTYVAEFRELLLPAIARDEVLAVDREDIREADRVARLALVSVGSQLIIEGDREQFAELAARLAEPFDE